MSHKRCLEIVLRVIPRIAALVFAALAAYSLTTAHAASAAPGPSTPARAFSGHEPESVRRLDATLEALAGQDLFSGVVLVAQRDRIVFQGVYGMASREYGIANSPDTQFNMASASKMFTAATIGVLVDRGKLRFDDPIGKYLDASWLEPHLAAKITIAQLLSHTSGLTDYFTPRFVNASRLLYRNVDDFKPLVVDSKLLFEPGTKWSYSNTGFLLLGAIIETVTGQSYYDYVRKVIFAPAGMTRTAALELDQVNRGYAQGYAKVPRKPPPLSPEGKSQSSGIRPDYSALAIEQAEFQRQIDRDGFTFRNNVFDHVIRGGPGGGMFSTASDLLKFANAFTGGRLMSPQLINTMMAPKPPAAPRWGYGMMLADGGVGHGGGFPGISTVVIFYPDGWRTIILANIDAGAFVAYDALLKLAGSHTSAGKP